MEPTPVLAPKEENDLNSSQVTQSVSRNMQVEFQLVCIISLSDYLHLNHTWLILSHTELTKGEGRTGRHEGNLNNLSTNINKQMFLTNDNDSYFLCNTENREHCISIN